MAADTSRYSFPYQQLGDAPDGPALGEDLAVAVESSLGALEDRVNAGYLWVAQQRFTASSAFTKATYPGARKVRVRVQGGGGGGGGCAANAAGNVSAAGGGEGGAYAEAWLDVAALASSVTVTVGAAGAAGATTPGAGGIGGTSSFGTAVSATGGAGGPAGSTAATAFAVVGGSSTPVMTGELQIGGSAGGFGVRLGTIAGQHCGGSGGDGVLGRGGAGGNNAAGTAGLGYGGGGGGASSAPSAVARAGGAGTAGIVIVDVYA